MVTTTDSSRVPIRSNRVLQQPLYPRFSAFHGTRRIITAFIAARILFRTSSQITQLHDIPLCLRFILILSSHLYLCLPTNLFPLGVSNKLLYIFLFSAIRATCPAHFIFLALLNVYIMPLPQRSSLCCFLQSPVTFSFLGPNISSVPFSQIPPAFVPLLI